MYIQQKNLFNDVKMQLKEQIACCYLEKKKQKTQLQSKFSIKMNTQKNECMIC